MFLVVEDGGVVLISEVAIVSVEERPDLDWFKTGYLTEDNWGLMLFGLLSSITIYSDLLLVLIGVNLLLLFYRKEDYSGLLLLSLSEALLLSFCPLELVFWF